MRYKLSNRVSDTGFPREWVVYHAYPTLRDACEQVFRQCDKHNAGDRRYTLEQLMLLFTVAPDTHIPEYYELSERDKLYCHWKIEEVDDE